ncbi:hypothetical protein G7054_g3187 [Neopestalotiopsis clavispora]|nr:hypothetical protein G7054_g3187 [Neopestalotiopsis clavispora]
MPPKRKSDTQAGPATGKSNKRQATESQSEHENSGDESSKSDGEDLSKRDPYDYYCINRHFFDFEDENEDKDEDDQLDEDELGEKYEEM